MKICILGGGLTSLVLARSLSSCISKIDIIIKKHKKSTNTLRTIGISDKNVEFLLKLFPEILSIGNGIKKIEIINDNNENILNFGNNRKSLFFMFKNEDLFKMVKKTVDSNENIKIKSTKQLPSYHDLKKHNYDLIIDTNLDSDSSNKYFYKKINKDYFGSAYINIIKHKKIKNNVARQTFTKFGPLAFLPISPDLTSIVYSINNNEDKFVKQIELEKLVKSYNNFYEILSFKNFEKFNLKFSLLKEYYQENILAFGDKLHKIHPLAGQGFNMIIRDIKLLTEIFENKIKIGLYIDPSDLKEFQNKSRYKNVLFATGIDLIHEFFLIEKKIPKKISKKIFNLLDGNKNINNYFTNIANKGF